MVGVPLLSIAAYLATINLAAFGMFALDKHRARTGRWRIQESTLLTLAALGGIVGAVTAQHGLRHKTRKEPFRTHLYLSAGAQLMLLIAASVPTVRQAALLAIQ